MAAISRMNPGYKDDLAYVHDVGFGDYARNAAGPLLAELRRTGIRNGLIVELGCGSGILAAELTRAGYDVLGIDLSEPMLKLARKRAPEARFVCASLLRTKLPICNAVISIGECLNYTFDSNDDVALARFFGRVYRALRPGGVFIFDFAEPGQINSSMPVLRLLQGPDWMILLDGSEDRKQRTFTRAMTVFRKVGELYRRSEEVHRIRLFTRAQIRHQLRRAGFRVHMLPDWQTASGRRVAVLLATKPVGGERD